MNYVSSFEAKTHLSKILAEVAKGKEYVITKHNKEIAKIVPCGKSKEKVKEAIEAMKKIRISQRATKKEILEWIKEGRR